MHTLMCERLLSEGKQMPMITSSSLTYGKNMEDEARIVYEKVTGMYV